MELYLGCLNPRKHVQVSINQWSLNEQPWSQLDNHFWLIIRTICYTGRTIHNSVWLGRAFECLKMANKKYFMTIAIQAKGNL